MSALAMATDPFTSALRFSTAPYARGVATLELELEPASGGRSNVVGYTFSVFQSRFGVQTADLQVSYVISLAAPLGAGPVTLDIGYTTDLGPGTATMFVPSGTLPGTALVIPIPAGSGPALLETVEEHAAPAPGAPSGPDKWKLTALLGNTSRLLALLLGERRSVAATGRDVLDQHHVLTARAASLDRIGEALGVPRLLPAAYRLDLDPNVIALYHLDDAVAPVVDTIGQHPGASRGAHRGVPGKIVNCAEITAAGGITIPDDTAFAIGAGASFTVEMFAQIPAIKPGTLYTLAVKRSHEADNSGPGWALTAELSDIEGGGLTFSVTDGAGTVATVVAGANLASWFHVAGVLDGAKKTISIFVNGIESPPVSLSGLAAVKNCADIGIGADRTGQPLAIDAFIDEVRFSNVARTDFTSVMSGTPYSPDAGTIALYHLDETDDLIDEATARHYGLNHGALRGVPARFDAGVRFTGDPLPEAECASEAQFQHLLRTGAWDRSKGTVRVAAGAYTRFGYRQGAISVPGIAGGLQPVFVNDAPAIDQRVRGMVTTACYGFVPDDLDQTIANLQAAGRSIQEAIDYFGDWNGEPESFYTAQYTAHAITAPHESCLPSPGLPTWIRIAGDPELAIDASASFTVEAFIRPDAVIDDYPRAIAASRSSRLRPGEPVTNEEGWALAVCGCECIPNNVQWTLGDSAGNLITVLAGVDLADGSFHHVAGVLDRDAGTALLFIDGVEVAKESVGALAAIAGATDVIIGNDPALDAPYAGVIDEVRLSRVARRSFHPVLGEGDERYRQRLAIFTPYRLPSSIMMLRGIRALSLPTTTTADEVAQRATQLLMSYGPAADDGQLDLIETDSQRFCAKRQFRILPARILPGQSIAGNGKMPADEAEATGDYAFHREALVRHDDAPGIVFANETARWMILRAAAGLEELAALVQAISPKMQVVVQTAWADTSALHSQGRSLDIGLANAASGMDLALLAAMAHYAGVDFVANFVGAGFVRMSFAAGEDLDLGPASTVASGEAIQVAVSRPMIASPLALSFRIVRCGPGDGTLAADPTNPAGSIFTGSTLGQVTVVASYRLADGSILRGSRTINIAPMTLDGCTSIDSEGHQGVTEAESAGPPETDFQESYLISSAVAGVNYATAEARRMQLPLDIAVQRLAALVSAEPGSPTMTVLAAYDSTATTLQAVGRGLVVAPSTTAMSAARLGALAFRSGFAYIERRRYPASVYASVAPGPRFQIVRSQIQRLWPNARISGLGEFMAGEFEAAGPPDSGFTVAMLNPYSNAAVAFAQGVSNLVQPPLAAALDKLVTGLAGDGVAGVLQVIGGFTPSATDLTSVGRAVLARHPNVAPERLSGYALAAGFGFVQHQTNVPGGPAVYAAAYATDGAPLRVFGEDDLILNELCELSVQPELPVNGVLEWCVTPCCGAKISMKSALPPPGALSLFNHKIVRGEACGGATIDAGFSLDDAAASYQFIVTRRMSDLPDPRLTKDQYDDLLNFIEAYIPIGVEAITRDIRGYVQGFQRPPGWSQLPTGATFPRYRTRRS